MPFRVTSTLSPTKLRNKPKQGGETPLPGNLSTNEKRNENTRRWKGIPHS
jgi:hypothetical protein